MHHPPPAPGPRRTPGPPHPLGTDPVGPAPLRVALLGFSAFERSTLASVFRLAASRLPSYVLVPTFPECDFVVADADHAPSVQLVTAAERTSVTVFIGQRPPPNATAWMARPIDPLHVLRELDAMAVQRGLAAAYTPGQPPRPVPQVGPLLGPVVGTAATTGTTGNGWPQIHDPLDASADDLRDELSGKLSDQLSDQVSDQVSDEIAEEVEQDVEEVFAQALPAPPAPPPAPRALLVDDSTLALHFLAGRLAPWGLQCDLATGSARAIELLAHNDYDFVFLDVELGDGSDLDGLALCQHIRRHRGGRAPALLALVSAHRSELDRARGTLAGCDAYLGKPLQADDLAKLLRRQGLILTAPDGPTGLTAPPSRAASPAASP